MQGILLASVGVRISFNILERQVVLRPFKVCPKLIGNQCGYLVWMGEELVPWDASRATRYGPLMDTVKIPNVGKCYICNEVGNRDFGKKWAS